MKPILASGFYGNREFLKKSHKAAKNLTFKAFLHKITVLLSAVNSNFAKVQLLIRDVFMEPNNPRISVDYTGDVIIIAFTDEKILEENDIQVLQQSVMSVIDQNEQISLILDFCSVRFLSSAVLGLLIRISKKIYEGNGQLRLCNINPKIYEVFKITRLNKIFDIHPDAEAASRSLNPAD